MSFSTKIKKVDYKLLILLISIPLASLVVLYSAGYSENINIKLAEWFPLTIHSAAFLKQLVNLCIAMLALLVGFFIDIKYIKKLSIPVYILMVILLIAVFLVGSKSHGALRWIALGSFRFQPSEFAKFSMILMLSYYCSKFPPMHLGYNLRALILPGFIILFPILLILAQPDLGTSLSVLGISVSILLLVGVKKRILTITGILSCVSILPMWYFVLKPYQKQRILTLFNPEADPLGTGYHIIQSKIAVGSGGISGKGFMQGSQTQLEFLPEHTTDFIFSVLAEEWGFFGSVFLLGLYFLLIYRLLDLARKCRDPYQTLFCFGFAAFLLIHVFVNIGMVVGILPVVGLPLPLFSYGGSAMLIIMFMAGIALNISSSRKQI